MKKIRGLKKTSLYDLELGEDENKIENEADSFIPVDKKEKEKIIKLLFKAGEERKSKVINFRTTNKTYALLKERAELEGLGYQTLINSILHKYITGQFIEKDKLEQVLEFNEHKIHNIYRRSVMARRKSFHLTHDKKQGNWKLIEQGSKKTIRRFSTKDEGVKISSGIVKNKGNSQLKIHKVDGKIQEERTYGNDPRKYKG